MRLALALLLLTPALHAQWQIQQSNTTADLRGIHALGNGVAWASGSKGTVLHTVDNGTTWQVCAVPPDAHALDFRAIQGVDADTALVMSSGKGSLSRLYKTQDGCRSWALLLVNPDADGFWDALRFQSHSDYGILVGDPVNGRFPLWFINAASASVPFEHFKHQPRAAKGEAIFAASNSTLFVGSAFFDFWLATGGVGGARTIKRINHDFDSFGFYSFPATPVPVRHNSESSGIFSVDFRSNPKSFSYETQFLIGVAVGGDYKLPDSSTNIAATTMDGGKTWKLSATQPHGYRSAVAYFLENASWIAVGPNGTDISRDDGRNWYALTPSQTGAPDEDKNWNALSLPFVVGPHGRIGLLREDAMRQESVKK